MNFEFKTEKKENSQMLLTITFSKDEIKSKYDEKLREIQKEIIIKGFRKGKAPISLIEAKYKDAILNEVSADVLDLAFKDIYDKLEKKPLPNSIPTIKEYKNIELDKDYSVDLIYDVYPEFQYDDYTKIEIEKDEIVVEKDDIEKRIKEYLKEIATIESKDGKLEKNDIAYIKFVAKEDDKEIEKSEGTHIIIDDNNPEDIAIDLIGLKKGDKKTLKRKKNNKDIEIEVEILDVKKEVIPELTDETVKDIDSECSSAKEFKEKIEKELKKYSEEYSREKTIEKILDKLTESYKGEIPESMIQSTLENSYNNLLSKARGNEKFLQKSLNIKNKDEFKEKSRDNAIKQVKSILIIKDLIEKEKIEVTDEDMDKYLEKLKANNDKLDKNIMMEYLKNNNQLRETIKNEIEIEKLYDKLLESVNVKKGKKIKFSEIFNT
ncbi:MAG TPA: trigger factor [Spirochaetota bacterium]|nr:trigger factor [Spirochaetota bacterium]HOL57413.1 trigger factor [Spirochaetota bacterium]HPP05028.1 trigger factor [Spirochaetota bacterium]